MRAALATDRGTIRIGQSAQDQLDILEAALAASHDADVATRAHLTALVAQSLVRTDRAERRTALAHEALAAARASGDASTFALVAAHVLHALWAPGAAPLRAALAREATAAVRDATDPNLIFVVHFAAYCAAVCAGEAADAAAYLDRLHEVADEVRDPQMRWGIGVLDAFVATMVGAFADAERIVAETVELGVQIGVQEAIAVFAGQSFALGTFAGRHAELLPFVEQGIEAAAGRAVVPARPRHRLLRGRPSGGRGRHAARRHAGGSEPGPRTTSSGPPSCWASPCSRWSSRTPRRPRGSIPRSCRSPERCRSTR